MLVLMSGTTAAPSASSGAVYENGLSAYPNPTAGRGTVRVSAAAPGPVTVSVFDALGRRVAVLYDGMLMAGVHDLPLAAEALAPGVYVVHVRARPDSGAAWSEVQRITVAR